MQQQQQGNINNNGNGSLMRVFKGSAAKKINKKKIYKDNEYKVNMTFSIHSKTISFKLFELKDCLIDEGSKSGSLNDFENYFIGDEIELDNYLFVIDEEIKQQKLQPTSSFQQHQHQQHLKQQQIKQTQPFLQQGNSRSLAFNQDKKGFDYFSPQSQDNLKDSINQINEKGFDNNDTVSKSSTIKNDIEQYLKNSQPNLKQQPISNQVHAPFIKNEIKPIEIIQRPNKKSDKELLNLFI